MNSAFRLALPLVVFSTLISSCTQPEIKIGGGAFKGSRQLAYDQDYTNSDDIDPKYHQELMNNAQKKGHRVEFPPGFSDEEKTLMWHMSEGSEVFPTLWLLNMKSATSKYPDSPFLEKLDEKFGLIPDYLPEKSSYPLKWIGLTAAWSDEHPVTQDIFLEGNEEARDIPKVKKLQSGKASIAMTGVNCTFCHTGVVTLKDGTKTYSTVIEGAPAMVDARGFFRDMYGSTIKAMASEEHTIQFLKDMKVANAEEVGKKFSDDFKTAIGIQPTFKSELVKILEKAPVIGDKVGAKKAKEVKEIFYNNRDVIHEYTVKFLKLTYGLKEVPETLHLRMKYFAKLGSANPAIEETASGYGRTDAFGRIANEVARGFNPIPLTAPVSMPYMYGIKYKAMFHYNANTNSVIARNIGQSFGLGAILTKPNAKGSEKFESTSNLHNLITMEKILYKAKVPEFQEHFPAVKIIKAAAVQGCQIYQNKCMGCHEADDKRVGPQKALISYKVLPVKTVGTDGIYLKNQATPINGKPFRKGLFDFTDAIKAQYFKEHNISDEKVSQWANSSLRGVEIFRDTVLGDSRFKDDEGMNYVTIEPGRGYAAKNLAGIWSTAPFLHNGSVASVYELLLPASKRKKLFVMGSTVLDPIHLGFLNNPEVHPHAKIREGEAVDLAKLCEYDETHCLDVTKRGNSNAGHEPSMYGGELRHDEKLQLIEFLKVLRPETEYAWTSTPVYKIENGKCVAR